LGAQRNAQSTTSPHFGETLLGRLRGFPFDRVLATTFSDDYSAQIGPSIQIFSEKFFSHTYTHTNVKLKVVFLGDLVE